MKKPYRELGGEITLSIIENGTADVYEVLTSWLNRAENSHAKEIELSPEDKEYIKNMYESRGFRDVVVHTNGKVDGTINAFRYLGLRETTLNTNFERDGILDITATLSYDAVTKE